MHGVEGLRLQPAQAGHPQRHYFETFHLHRGEDLASMSRRHRVGFDYRKCALNAHKRLFTFSPISAGDEQTVMPASSMASILSAAAPDPPETIAPAWPIRRPGGAVCPAMKPITGLRTCSFT